MVSLRALSRGTRAFGTRANCSQGLSLPRLRPLLCQPERAPGISIHWGSKEWLSKLSEPRTLYVGIDPDLNGAIACVVTGEQCSTWEGSSSHNLAEWWQEAYPHSCCFGWDMPVAAYRLLSGKARRRVCSQGFHEILKTSVQHSLSDELRNSSIVYVVERPTPLPDTDGWQSVALSAYSFGVIMGVMGANGVRALEVPSISWKSHAGLRGCTKDDCRDLVKRMFPPAKAAFRRKRDHGRADAVLLACWAALKPEAHEAENSTLERSQDLRPTSGRLKHAEQQQLQDLEAVAEVHGVDLHVGPRLHDLEADDSAGDDKQGSKAGQTHGHKQGLAQLGKEDIKFSLNHGSDEPKDDLKQSCPDDVRQHCQHGLTHCSQDKEESCEHHGNEDLEKAVG